MKIELIKKLLSTTLAASLLLSSVSPALALQTMPETEGNTKSSEDAGDVLAPDIADALLPEIEEPSTPAPDTVVGDEEAPEGSAPDIADQLLPEIEEPSTPAPDTVVGDDAALEGSAPEDAGTSILQNDPATKATALAFTHTAVGQKWNCVWDTATNTLTLGTDSAGIAIGWSSANGGNDPWSTPPLPAGVLSADKIEHIVFESTVQGIKTPRFLCSGLYYLKTVSFEAANPKITGEAEYMFRDTYRLEEIIVPQGFDASQCSDISNIFEHSGIKTVDLQKLFSGFRYNQGINSIINAFANQRSTKPSNPVPEQTELVSVHLPKGVQNSDILWLFKGLVF